MFGTNPVVSAPRATHVTERLAALDLLVVADFVLSETAAMADVVLPVTQWAEETGTMTNLEGRVILRQQAVAPPAGVRSDLEVIAGLAERLGSPVPFATDAEEVFAELRRASAGGRADYGGITYDRIRAEHGVFWPCPDAEHPGTPRLFADTFATRTAGPGSCAVEHRGPAEAVDDEFPVHLTTGRVLAQYQSGAQTRRVARPARHRPRSSSCTRCSPTGSAPATASSSWSPPGAASSRHRPGSSTTIRPDTVFVPFHWVGANRLHQRRARPVQPDARVQGLRRARCAA